MIQLNPTTHTTNPHEGVVEISKMPTYHCNNCGIHVWDKDVGKAFSNLTGGSTGKDVKNCLDGAKCPECGHVQRP